MDGDQSSRRESSLDYYFSAPSPSPTISPPVTPTFSAEESYFYPPLSPTPETQGNSLHRPHSRLIGPRPLGLPSTPSAYLPQTTPNFEQPTSPFTKDKTQRRRPAPLIPTNRNHSHDPTVSTTTTAETEESQTNFDSPAARFARLNSSSFTSPVPQLFVESPIAETIILSRNSSQSSTNSSIHSTLTPTSSFKKSKSPMRESLGSLEEGLVKECWKGKEKINLNVNEEGLNEEALEYLNVSLLSNIAAYVKEVTSISYHFKGPVEHAGFRGRDCVTAIHRCLPESQTRSFASSIASVLLSEGFISEVDSEPKPLRDSDRGGVFVFSENTFSEDEIELPQGILTSLTKCYSSSCDGNDPLYSCYSFSCPNRIQHLHRQPSLVSTSSYSSDLQTEEAENWESSVEKSVIEDLSKSEIARQSLIYELIQGEAAYLKDLNTIETGFVQPLREASPPIIPPAQLDDFLVAILGNIAEIRAYSSTFLANLLARQEQQYPVIEKIGDIVLESALDWSNAYTTYTRQFPLMELRFKRERESNPLFANFLLEFSRLKEANRQGFEHFQTRSTFRAVRYSLLLEPIAKHTPIDNPDREAIDQALQVIKNQSKEADEAVSDCKSSIQIEQYSRQLYQPKSGLNLDLENPERKHFLSTKAYRVSSSGLNEFSEIHLILFDHYLVPTKTSRVENWKYSISRRPIPLELIKLLARSFEDPPVPRSSGFHLRRRESEPNSSHDTTLAFPLYFRLLGSRENGTTAFYFDSANVRKIWATKLKEAIELRIKFLEKKAVVKLVAITDSKTFGCASPTMGSMTPAPMGKPTTSFFFESAGERLLAVGTSKGLFISSRGRALQHVLHIADISSAQILQKEKWIVILAGKVLLAYSLETLVPSADNKNSASDVKPPAPQRLSGTKEVTFFKAGQCFKAGKIGGSTLVIFAKKNTSIGRESVFNALECVPLDETKVGKSRFLGFGAKQTEAFRNYKSFFIPSNSYSLSFLSSHLAIICAHGVEIMDLESLRTLSLPDFKTSSSSTATILAGGNLEKRCNSGETLGMFRIEANFFLICFGEFCFAVDKHGEPLDRHIIEWESRPETVAYQHGHLFAISSTMIEIRNALTGQLVQVITGKEIRLTNDGIGVESGVVTNLHVTMLVGGFHSLFELELVS